MLAKRHIALTLLLTCFWAFDVLAHGPTPQKSDHKLTIKAPLEKVWESVKSPKAICDWHLKVKSCEYNEATKERVFEVEGGERFSEILLEVDENSHTVYLRQGDPNVKALPVSSYSARIQVEDNGDGSVTVRWKGRYYRGDTGNFPAGNLNDEAAVKAMDEWIKTGLEGLRSYLTR